MAELSAGGRRRDGVIGPAASTTARPMGELNYVGAQREEAEGNRSPAAVYNDAARIEVHRFLPVFKTLLDVGCFKGAFGASLSAPGKEIWGIELNRDAAAVAATRLQRIIVGAFPDALPNGVTFDCITFLDVLEHLARPEEALRAAASFLAPGGSIVASIPNVRHRSVVVPLLMRGRWEYRSYEGALGV